MLILTDHMASKCKKNIKKVQQNSINLSAIDF